jgi:hypothetical protein
MSNKSIFLNQSTEAKSVFNPVIGAGDLSIIDTVNYNYLTTIDQFYGQNAANGTFSYIPTNYRLYTNLYVAITNIIQKVSDYRMKTLLNMVLELLSGSYSLSKISGSNILLTVDKLNLQKQIQTILENKNAKNIDTVGGSGQLNLTKTFTLAPVYNYYIIIYGMPVAGKGFDPIKIGYLTDLLKNNNINPYK